MERRGKKRTLVLLPKHEQGTTNIRSIKEMCPTRQAEDSQHCYLVFESPAPVSPRTLATNIQECNVSSLPPGQFWDSSVS